MNETVEKVVDMLVDIAVVVSVEVTVKVEPSQVKKSKDANWKYATMAGTMKPILTIGFRKVNGEQGS
jgi:hypothetical protein